MSGSGTPGGKSTASTTANASALLRQALEGHYDGWQSNQELKMRRFIEETMSRGLANLHDPMMWGHNSMKFLTPDDMPPKWMGPEEAMDLLYEMADSLLNEMNVTKYHLDHGVRDFAGGKSFTFFRLCNDAETSLQNWLTEQTVKIIECVEESVGIMLKAARNGDADVWAKLPSARFSNFLLKDEPLPVGLTREQAVNEITKILTNVLAKEFDLPDVDVTPMGNVMSGTYFKLTYHIRLPVSPARRTAGSRTPVRSPGSAVRSPGSSGSSRRRGHF